MKNLQIFVVIKTVYQNRWSRRQKSLNISVAQKIISEKNEYKPNTTKVEHQVSAKF